MQTIPAAAQTTAALEAVFGLFFCYSAAAAMGVETAVATASWAATTMTAANG